jgi:hypothetical protein
MVEAFILAPLNFQYETKDGPKTIHAGFYGGKADDSATGRQPPRGFKAAEMRVFPNPRRVRPAHRADQDPGRASMFLIGN